MKDKKVSAIKAPIISPIIETVDLKVIPSFYTIFPTGAKE